MGRPRSKDGEPKPGYGCTGEAEDKRNTVGMEEDRVLRGRPVTTVDDRGWLLLTAPSVAYVRGISSPGHSHSVILPLAPVSDGPSKHLPSQVRPLSVPTEPRMAPSFAGPAQAPTKPSVTYCKLEPSSWTVPPTYHLLIFRRVPRVPPAAEGGEGQGHERWGRGLTGGWAAPPPQEVRLDPGSGCLGNLTN